MDENSIRELSKREALIIELVFILAKGDRKSMGFPLEEIVQFLTTPLSSKQGKTALECLNSEEHAFIEELEKLLKLS